eukprot:4588743-Prymnesium_polylepis.1
MACHKTGRYSKTEGGFKGGTEGEEGRASPTTPSPPCAGPYGAALCQRNDVVKTTTQILVNP